MALRLKSSCGEIEVLFHHKVLTAEEISDTTAVFVDGPRRCSTYVIKVDGVQQGQGTIICHPKDNFDKALGRQKSLAQAIYIFNKAIRKAIWEKYESEIGFA